MGIVSRRAAWRTLSSEGMIAVNSHLLRALAEGENLFRSLGPTQVRAPRKLTSCCAAMDCQCLDDGSEKIGIRWRTLTIPVPKVCEPFQLTRFDGLKADPQLRGLLRSWAIRTDVNTTKMMTKPHLTYWLRREITYALTASYHLKEYRRWTSYLNPRMACDTIDCRTVAKILSLGAGRITT